MTTALVTGASRGLGRAFAERLAADGYDLVLVGRDRHALGAVAEAVGSRGGRAELLPADLTDPIDRAAVERRLSDPRRPVDLLVNNAADEVDGEFADVALADLQAELDLNVTAVMRLTHAALPGMRARGVGAVVNVASFAGYLAARGSSYAATKAYVLAFTDTVAASLTGSGVSMIALCAGRLRTGRHVAPAHRHPLWLDPAAVVDRCLTDLAAGRRLCTPGVVYRGVVAALEGPRRGLRRLARAAGADRERRSPGGPSVPRQPGVRDAQLPLEDLAAGVLGQLGRAARRRTRGSCPTEPAEVVLSRSVARR